MTTEHSAKGQAEAIRAGDRRAVARAITLIESTRADHRVRADALMAELLPYAGNSVRIGISGVPGVGKSTFIETFGLKVIDDDHKIAVLAVDPSSPKTGGSILGDKTRMEELSKNTSAFIRPSPSGGTLGGVARRTREVMLVTEAAGFDVVIVETVGVGQSETAVAGLVDMFILLIVPGGGDELQGIKKGIVELADLIVVNKADGDLMAAAERAKRDYGAALHLLRPTSPDWRPKVMTCSSLHKNGIGEVWDVVGEFHQASSTSGNFEQRRKDQAKAWMWDEVNETVSRMLRTDQNIAALLPGLESQVQDGKMAPAQAARKILGAFASLNDFKT
jgi:LAO/AO transport system kinase